MTGVLTQPSGSVGPLLADLHMQGTGEEALICQMSGIET